MNASIDLLLDKAGLADAQVLDFREGAREVFDIRCVQMLDAEGVASLSTNVLYVADNAALTYLAGCLDGMSVAFAGDMPAAKAFAPVEKCRVVCVPEFASAGDLLNTLVAAQRAVDGFDEQLMWASVATCSWPLLPPRERRCPTQPSAASWTTGASSPTHCSTTRS